MLFTVAAALLLVVALREYQSSVSGAGEGLALPRTEFGVVATTILALTGLLGLYRALTAEAIMPGVLSVVFWGPATVWASSVFVSTGSTAADLSERRFVSELIIPLVAVVGAVLLVRGLRRARWIEVFVGLSATEIVLVGTVVAAQPRFADQSNGLLALVVLASMTGLYGMLVDIEVAAYRSSRALKASHDRLVGVIRGNEDLLHDLRSGLLSIEAAARTSGDRLAPTISAEAARLRRLTFDADQDQVEFDLVAAVTPVVETKRASGHELSFTAPEKVEVCGYEADLLAIIENLLSNALRHGRPPVGVEIVDYLQEIPEPTDGHAKNESSRGAALAVVERVVEVVVTNGGVGFTPSLKARWFDRGFTTSAKGSGIGLDRVRSLAERNDAEIQVEADGDNATRSVLRLRFGADTAALPDAETIRS